MHTFKKFDEYKPQVSVAYSEYVKNISEKNKIDAEINELNESFTKKPAFYISIVSTLIPSILAIIAFYGTNAGDFFDNKIKEIQLEKRELQIDISNLESEKEKLKQNKASLESEFLQRQKVLEDKFLIKEKELEDDISAKVTGLEKTVQLKNDDLTKRLAELDDSRESQEDLKTSLRASLNENKNKNELIINLNQIIKEEKAANNRLLNKNKDLGKDGGSLKLSNEQFKRKSIKDSVIVFLLSRGWKQAGYIRIRDALNQSENNSLSVSQIKEVLISYPGIFKEVKFKGEQDIEGVAIIQDVSIPTLIE